MLKISFNFSVNKKYQKKSRLTRDTLSPAFHPREGVRQQRRPVEVALSGNF